MLGMGVRVAKRQVPIAVGKSGNRSLSSPVNVYGKERQNDLSQLCCSLASVTSGSSVGVNTQLSTAAKWEVQRRGGSGEAERSTKCSVYKTGK